MDIKKLEEWYKEELARRDKEIDQLREDNAVLMKASLKSSEKIAELTEKLKKSVDKK